MLTVSRLKPEKCTADLVNISRFQNRNSARRVSTRKTKPALKFLKVKNSMYYSFFDNMKKGNVILSKNNKRGELILLKDDGNKQKHTESNSKIRYYQALPCGSVRAKNENDEAFISLAELSNKETDGVRVSSSKKKAIPYKIDYWNYLRESWEKKIEFKKNKQKQAGKQKYNYSESSIDKHKRSKSQTINSIKARKGYSAQESSSEEVSHLLQQHFQNNSKTSYNLVNEYLENPGKQNNITVTGTTSVNTESKPVNRSRGKRDQSNSFSIKNNIWSLQRSNIK